VANNVAERCTVHPGDNQATAPALAGCCDRVHLGLIPSSSLSWPLACAALHRDRPGMLHVHENVYITGPGGRDAGRGRGLPPRAARQGWPSPFQCFYHFHCLTRAARPTPLTRRCVMPHTIINRPSPLACVDEFDDDSVGTPLMAAALTGKAECVAPAARRPTPSRSCSLAADAHAPLMHVNTAHPATFVQSLAEGRRGGQLRGSASRRWRWPRASAPSGVPPAAPIRCICCCTCRARARGPPRRLEFRNGPASSLDARRAPQPPGCGSRMVENHRYQNSPA
jgi:hypothetical protein